VVVDVRVTGLDGFTRLAASYRAAGQKLPRELYRAAARSTKPMRVLIKAGALADLPHRGGLNVWASRATVRTTVRGGGSPGVRVVGSKRGGDLAALNAGTVYHPTFGHRPLVRQSVPGGFWDDAVDRTRPLVRAEFLHAVDVIAAQIHS
jgi:hypothetical protein